MEILDFSYILNLLASHEITSPIENHLRSLLPKVLHFEKVSYIFAVCNSCLYCIIVGILECILCEAFKLNNKRPNLRKEMTNG